MRQMLYVKRLVLPFSGKLNAILKRKRKENSKKKEKCIAYSVWELVSLQLGLLIAIQSRFPLCRLSWACFRKFDIFLSPVYSYQGIIKIRRLQVQLDTLGELGKIKSIVSYLNILVADGFQSMGLVWYSLLVFLIDYKL